MGPFLLSEEEQDEENRRQMQAVSSRPRGNPNALFPITPKPDKPAPRPTTFRSPVARAGVAEPMIDPMDLMAADHLSQGPMIAKATNDAIQDEMDRRVAISREQRRMALELEKKRMDQETERMKIDAMLKRLEAESGYKTIVH